MNIQNYQNNCFLKEVANIRVLIDGEYKLLRAVYALDSLFM